VLKWSDIKTFMLMRESRSGGRFVCNHRFQIYNVYC